MFVFVVSPMWLINDFLRRRLPADGVLPPVWPSEDGLRHQAPILPALATTRVGDLVIIGFFEHADQLRTDKYFQKYKAI